MLRASVSVLALVACGSLAVAADLEGPSYLGSLKDDVAAPVAHNWSGFYIGGHVGYGWADWDSHIIHPAPQIAPKGFSPDASLGGDGWFGGLQVGAAKQIGPWVLGVETDVSWPDMDGSHTYNTDFDTNWAVKSSIDLMGTGRVKVGYSMGRVQVYGTAGVAWAIVDTDLQTISIVGGPMANLSARTHHVGWTAGAGLEWAMTDRVSFKADYLYIDLGEQDHDPKGLAYAGTPNEFAHHELMSEDLKMHTVRVGVNVKIGN